MTEQELLAELQTLFECSHVKALGEPCDRNSGGWTTCLCAVMAAKAIKDPEKRLIKTLAGDITWLKKKDDHEN